MKFNYKFSNLLGTVYVDGNLVFTPTGDSIISPVGNRVTIFDLKNNKTETLPIECKLNITCVEISPDGLLLILVNKEGECYLCNTKSKSIIHRYYFARAIHACKFSPNGRKFAVCREDKVLIYKTPGHGKEFNPFVLERTFYGAYDETVCLDWTSDSRVLICGSKDMSSRVHATERFTNLICYVLGGHNEEIAGCFFEKNSLNAYTVSRNGRLNVWECDTELKGLIEKTAELTEESYEEEKETKDIEEDDEGKTIAKIGIKYIKKSKHGIRDALESSVPIGLLSCDYNKNNQILVSGFSNGCFLLHELPQFNMIHSLKISDQPITSCTFNKTGDWIGLACKGLGQLLVWEWQSETYILKQQGHFNNMTQVAYSPSGLYLASGGDDGKLKIWNTINSHCFVTFSEHNAPITGLKFKSNGQVVCSSSLDGTVRAFDLNRYRNFRTFTTPQIVQFSCLAIDSSGELVCAGGFDVFDIFLWSMKTGHLLETLNGHEGPISCIEFTTSVNDNAMLASGSWDKTCRVWNVYDGKAPKETYMLNSDVLSVCFRPDGKLVACSTLDAQITFIDINQTEQNSVVGTIECQHDLGYSRKETDKVTAKKTAFGKAFKSMCFTSDGEYIIAGGKSKYICIYSVKEEILVKRFEISCNMSFDGISEFLSRRKMTEWGNLSLMEGDDDDQRNKTQIQLPGVIKGDYSLRAYKPEIQVTSIKFSPTMQSWCACTTEGLLLYSIDSSLIFNPFNLDINITPKLVYNVLFNEKNYSLALIYALNLNEDRLCQLVIEHIPHTTIDIIVNTLNAEYIDKLIVYLSSKLDNTKHIEFYMMWLLNIVEKNANRMRLDMAKYMSIMCNLEKSLTKTNENLSKICDSNCYSIDYLIALNKLNKLNRDVRKTKEKEDDDDDNISLDDEDQEDAKTMEIDKNYETIKTFE